MRKIKKKRMVKLEYHIIRRDREYLFAAIRLRGRKGTATAAALEEGRVRSVRLKGDWDRKRLGRVRRGLGSGGDWDQEGRRTRTEKKGRLRHFKIWDLFTDWNSSR